MYSRKFKTQTKKERKKRGISLVHRIKSKLTPSQLKKEVMKSELTRARPTDSGGGDKVCRSPELD